MSTRFLAEYANSLDMIQRWSVLSLEESRLRRQRRNPWTGAVLVGVAAVLYLMLVWAMEGGL